MFLPWHRHFINKFEQELRKVNANVTLPYWDWSLDAAHPEKSPILSSKYMGSSSQGGCIPDGPFKNFTVKGNCVKRTFNPNPPKTITTFHSTSLLGELIRKNYTSYDEFRSAIEGSPHGVPHTFIGGDMSTMRSPADPLFYLHHAFIDKLWNDFQQENNKQFLNKYVSDPKSAQLIGYTGVNVADVLNLESMCVQYVMAGAIVDSPDSITWNVPAPAPLDDDWLKINHMNSTEVRKQETEIKQMQNKVIEDGKKGNIPPAPGYNDTYKKDETNSGVSFETSLGLALLIGFVLNLF
ncbi:Di-copper centre-containing protein [Rozella allomycis CSF55]|uniref:Di-copper centre-containing protein n=1 Tax=Rozella allomycis (strain CSF55) TaxID=988480 RepID=A0A075AZW6_ROZAC|nr:Tyrosinase domain-containing protein [Rozella allomycis CSF55]RKP16545.1 Di-copper centre-containing protein [Rozella allomycis CSF55]|eukprot:EPZ35886.1 Tyrosinase domain-containing protein [Rozella allomycis CSF55]